MNYNNLSVDAIRVDYDTPRCNRAKLDTGTFCNYDCEFCYYQGMLDIKTDYSKIEERINKLHEYGITQVDLSGGESSVHSDWFKILDYCNEKFEHISCLSNGWRFAKEDFVIKSKQHGLKEVLFSLHGYDEKSHDEIVRRKGAWVKILKAIENCQKHDIIVRVNCTVYQHNYKGLKDYHKIINHIKPLEVNFITLNFWVNNREFKPPRYVDITNEIKNCIDNIKNHVRYINVRYTPYCFMQGYEKHVCNQYQHIYDIYDWNKEIYDYDLDTSKQYSDKEKIDLGYAKARKDRLNDYKKPKECLNCKFFYICDGIENEVDDDVIPISGEKIQDVNYFRKDFYKNEI